MDHLNRAQRSENMAAVKGRNTIPELAVRKFLRKSGVFYRCHANALPGKPDISIKKYKLALDVHGCFWHGHLDCKKSKLPKTNAEFWQNKINQNRARDARTAELFKEMGFDYFIIWECELPKLAESCLSTFIELYHSRKQDLV